MMYSINETQQINLAHVERMELNERFKRIVFWMASGRDALKDFPDAASAESEVERLTELMGGT